MAHNDEDDDEEFDSSEFDSADEKEEISHKQSEDLLSYVNIISEEASARKRPVSKMPRLSRTEAYDESEFNLHATPSAPGNVGELSLADLVGSVKDTATYSSLKKSLSQLEHANLKLDAPLSRLQQDRVNRQAAYEEAKNLLHRWKPIVDSHKNVRCIGTYSCLVFLILFVV